MIVTADDIAAWASRFPGLLREFFHPEFKDVVDLHTWGLNITQPTKTFVPVPAWRLVQQAIAQHANLSQPCHDVVLPLQGEAGVGKTRSTYETVCALPGAAGLVLYTLDEPLALRVARQLLNDRESHAILIADECLVGTRVKLEEMLRGVRDRIRLIAITNTGVRPPEGAPEFWLERLVPETVQEILHQNFPDVPEGRRALYARLSGGFVKFAAQLCYDHAIIEQHGLIAGTAQKTQAYLEVAVRSDQQRLDVLHALSLVRRVGFRDEVAAELDDLCKLAKIDRDKTQQLAHQLKDVPGFVAQAGRYFYVTPAIIASAAFQTAWKQWVAPDAAAFLQNIPQSLFETFQERVAESGTPEMRKVVSDFFRNWLLSLRPANLSDPEVTKQAAMLVDTLPHQNFPLLRGLIETASLDELRAIRGDSFTGGWGPRRHLVWLAERLARFAAYFDDAERILVRLALAESEPHIGNSATRIWQQLFRVYLSGTETPFCDRLQRLEHHFLSDDSAIIPLAFGALEEVFNPHPMRMEGRPVVAGRITPRDWQPQSSKERDTCFQSAFDLVCQLAMSGNTQLLGLAQHFLVRHLRVFLARGWLDKLKSVLVIDRLMPNLLPRIVEQLQDFLHFESKQNGANELADSRRAYVKRVGQLLAESTPKDLPHRLIAIVGRDPWRPSIRDGEAEWYKEIDGLARELCSDPRQLETNLPWLCSPEARSAFDLGQALGRIDTDASLLDRIVGAIERTRFTALGQGYLGGLLSTTPRASPAVNERIDAFQARDPTVAYELIMKGGRSLRVVERVLDLVDRGSIPPFYLRGLAYGLGERKLTPDELLSVLQRLSPERWREDARAREAALEILGLYIYNLTDAQCRHLFASSELRELTGKILKSAVAQPGRASHMWFEVVKALLKAGDQQAIFLVTQALVCGEYEMREDAESFLVDCAADVPGKVMEALGQIIMEDRYKHQFFLDKYTNLFSALPVSVVAQWLGKVGVQGARRMARHLPPPFIDAEGRPRVPEVTAHVLRHFEKDKRTFREFCAGVCTTDGYWVEGGKKRERDALVAEQFLHHPLRRIREWARAESASARAEAERQRMEEEEETVF